MDPAAAVAFLRNGDVICQDAPARFGRGGVDGGKPADAAAAGGDIDDVIPAEELRARLCAAFYMLLGQGKGTRPQARRAASVKSVSYEYVYPSGPLPPRQSSPAKIRAALCRPRAAGNRRTGRADRHGYGVRRAGAAVGCACHFRQVMTSGNKKKTANEQPAEAPARSRHLPNCPRRCLPGRPGLRRKMTELVAALTAAVAAAIASDEELSSRFASGFRVVSFKKSRALTAGHRICLFLC